MKTSPATQHDGRLRKGMRMAAAATLFMAVVTAGEAARPEPADSKPKLISTTGGGGGGGPWSDIKELEAAAAKGNSRAWADLGELKLKGEHTPQDIPGGLQLLEKAAKAGQAAAAFHLAKAYDEGNGVTQDRTKALDYFRAAAAGKIPEAFYNLGASYASGRGTTRDYAEGLAWMILARKAGAGSEGENLLRERLAKMRRNDLIEKAVRRAPEIEAELAQRPVASFLPGAVQPTPSPTPSPRARLAPPPSARSSAIPEITVDRGTPANPVHILPPPPEPVR